MSKLNFTQARLGFSGEFTLRVLRADKSCRQELKFSNLILNQGINRLSEGHDLGISSGVIRRCYVGTGSSAPNVNQTQLDNLLATTSSIQSISNSNAQSAPWSTTGVLRFRFGTGVAEGNISEVGVGWDVSEVHNCFSRELIRDSEGDPTTITILSDEILDVTYRLKLNIPSATFSFIAALGPAEESGTVNGATSSTLFDDEAVWTTDQFVGYRVRITSGVGEGQVRIIASNTSDTLTLTEDWDTIPEDGFSDYEISDYLHTGAIRAQGAHSTAGMPSGSNSGVFNNISNIEGSGWRLMSDLSTHPGLTGGFSIGRRVGNFCTSEPLGYATDELAPINGSNTTRPLERGPNNSSGGVPTSVVYNGDGTVDMSINCPLDYWNPFEGGTDEEDYLGRISFRGQRRTSGCGGDNFSRPWTQRTPMHSWNVVFHPRIRKVDSKILDITFRLTLARQGELPA